MNHTFSQLGEVVTSVLHLKVHGFSVTKASINDGTPADPISSTCNVDGHDWEIRLHPALYAHGDGYYCSALELVSLGESRTGVTAVLSAKANVYETDDFVALKESKTVHRAFHRRMDRSLPIYIGVGKASDGESYSGECWMTVECTITIFTEPAQSEGSIPVPSSNLTQHLGELLRSQAGADVTFTVKGESFAAHKSVLAARSPVFMAEFFGEMKEEISQCVEIQDMDVAVFKAILHFIYTDEVPEFDEKPEEAATMAFAENLLNAAGRYGLNRLKVVCERRLALGMDVSTVAWMLDLAEKRNCSWLKTRCIEFIAGGSPGNLDAVLATEGYKQLVQSRPMVLTELLKAAHGNNSTCSCMLHDGIFLFPDPFSSTQVATLGTMNHTFTQLSEGVQSVHLLKIDGFTVTKATIGNNTNPIKSRCNVDGYDLEIRFYPSHHHHRDMYFVALELAFLGKPCTQGVKVTLRGDLVEYQSSGVEPRKYNSVSKIFKQPSDCTFPVFIGKGKARDLGPPASLTVECTITMFRDLKATRPPTSDLHQNLEQLLQSQAGADVMFTVSGESFAAHKNILAARSPIFRAEFFGEMAEKASKCVEIMDMDPQAFKNMLHFIYTDMVPHHFYNQQEMVDGTAMAQHLLVAADRYGLDRLKLMSEHKLSLSIGIETVASTLALAAQFNCSHLKAKCIEFISGGSSKHLDDILATDGYRHLEESSPSVLTELLKASHRNKRNRSTYS